MRSLLQRRRLTWLVFLACLILNVVIVTKRGAWESDLAGDPDEAAHAVTSLMIRDYLAGGWRQHPMAFAEQYYADFPKVAIGHYPPGFYLIAGIWMLPQPSIYSLFLLQAGLGATVCSMLFRITSKSEGPYAGMLAAALMGLLPAVINQLQLVMSDLLLVSLGLAAVMLWRDYLNRPTALRATGFGIITAAAILTKGSALALCVIPPLATLACARLDLMKKPSWWLCGLPVALLAAPWMLYSSKITAEGMLHVPLAQFLPEATAYYLREAPHTLGWPLFVTGIGGTALMMLRTRNHPVHAQAAAMGALGCGMVLVVLLVPAGLTTRYLLPCLPVLISGSVIILNQLMRGNTWSRVLGVLLAGACFYFMPGWREKRVDGFSAALERSGMPALSSIAAQHWLVASDPRGEGAVIAAAAFACERRAPSPLRVHRGSKELAQSDWMGRGYQAAFPDAESLLKHLDARGITRVFVDLSVADKDRKPHEKQLEEALAGATGQWKIQFEQAITRPTAPKGRMLVYERM